MALGSPNQQSAANAVPTAETARQDQLQMIDRNLKYNCITLAVQHQKIIDADGQFVSNSDKAVADAQKFYDFIVGKAS